MSTVNLACFSLPVTLGITNKTAQPFVAKMMRIALNGRAERDKGQKEGRARQKRIDEVRAELRQIEQEEKKIKALEREAARWERAEWIREYVEAFRERSWRGACAGS